MLPYESIESLREFTMTVNRHASAKIEKVLLTLEAAPRLRLLHLDLNKQQVARGL